jgi:hypothetical protein
MWQEAEVCRLLPASGDGGLLVCLASGKWIAQMFLSLAGHQSSSLKFSFRSGAWDSELLDSETDNSQNS